MKLQQMHDKIVGSNTIYSSSTVDGSIIFISHIVLSFVTMSDSTMFSLCNNCDFALCFISVLSVFPASMIV